MKTRSILMTTLCSLMLGMGFTACLEDDLEQPELPIEPETYPAYILNEGLWGANNANITRFYPQYKIDNLSDFYQEMNGTKMGDVANAMIEEDDNIFVVLNGSKYVALPKQYQPRQVISTKANCQAIHQQAEQRIPKEVHTTDKAPCGSAPSHHQPATEPVRLH